LPILPTHKPLEPAVVKPEAERSVISAPLSNAVSPIQPPVATAVKSAEKKSELTAPSPSKPAIKQLPGRPVIPVEKEVVGTRNIVLQENRESKGTTGIKSGTMLQPEQSATEVAPAVSSPVTEKEKSVTSQQVAVRTTTSSNEQVLYRSGVAAYKSGNCNEAIKQLSSFIASYPYSLFVGDAAIYRSDCIEKSR